MFNNDLYQPINLVGVGKDAPVVQNVAGGMQSKSTGDYTLLPPLALQAVAYNLEYGAKKYGDWNWLRIPVRDHINHFYAHSLAYVAGDTTNGNLEPLYDSNISHLIAAATRALFALEVALREREDIEVDL